jgi:hypothetical protein
MRYILRRPRTFWISACNLLGLCFSVAGVVLLFVYALPEVPPGGPGVVGRNAGGGPEWEAEMRRYNWNAHLGLGLVLIGTVLEMVPPFCTAIGSWRRRPRYYPAPRRSLRSPRRFRRGPKPAATEACLRAAESGSTDGAVLGG